MTKVVFASLLVMSSYFGFSQNTSDNVSVEKSIFGIHIGLSGFGVNHELKLTNQVALRSELAFIDLGTNSEGGETFFTELMFVIEPRWYYNLEKRVDKGKRIDGNRGNFVSIRANYFLYDISELGKTNYHQPLLAATWGISRTIGNHFYYEAGIGGGIGFDNDDAKKGAFIPYINLKIGYRF